MNINKNTFLTICINYNNDSEVMNFVNELYTQRGYNGQRTIVVDNSERDSHSTPLLSLEKNKNVLVFRSGKNLGYFGGAYWGLQQYIKEFSFPEWTIVSNTDIHFPDKDFFIKLSDKYKNNPPAVIAPDTILESEGGLPSSFTHQNPHFIYRPSCMRMHIYKWVARYYPFYITWELISALRHKLINTLGYKKQEQKYINKPMKIYAPFGAFIIFNKNYFNAGGTLQHGTFLFGEEIFVAETVRSLNLDIMYDPSLIIIHKEHSSISFLKSKNRALYARQAATYCADTFFHKMQKM